MSDAHDQAAPYVLGALAEDERAAFERHLATCPSCRESVRRLGEGLEAAFWEGSESPSADFSARVAASLGRDPSMPRWLPGILMVAAAIVVVVVGALAFTRGRDPVAEVLVADDAIEYVLTSTDAGPPGATLVVVYSPSLDRSVLTGSGLVDPPDRSTYQMWFVDASPIPAGTFEPVGGEVATLIDGDFRAGAVFGVTVEPAGGSDAPTGAILFAGDL